MGTRRVSTSTSSSLVALGAAKDVRDFEGFAVTALELSILPRDDDLHDHEAADDEEVEDGRYQTFVNA